MLITLLAAALLAGLCARGLGWLPGSDVLWIASGLTCGAAMVALGRSRPLPWMVASLLAAGCWGVVLAAATVDTAPPAPTGGLTRITFDVRRGGCGERGCYAEGSLVGCHELEPGSCVPLGTRVGVASDRELIAGARITALAKLRLRTQFDNPSPSARWPDTRAPVQASVRGPPRVDRASWLDHGIAALRNGLRRLLERTLEVPHAGIARALLLGEGSAVDQAMNEAIRAAGVSHVLAVSGMHVTLLVGAWVFALRQLWLRTPLALHWEARRASALLGVLLAPWLARACGGSPSAVRAAWTSTVTYLLIALGLRPAALPVAAFVIAVFAALDPRETLHPGFMLSVLATAALLADQPDRKAHVLMRALRESWRAWLATAPFLLLCFGQLSLVPMLANVALLPLGAALVPLAAGHALSAAIHVDSVLPTGSAFALASGAFAEAARVCAVFDPGLVLPPPTPLQAACCGVLTLTWLFPSSWRTRATLSVVIALVIGLAEWAVRHALADDELRVTFLDVGQGDATLIESGRGPVMLIDAGGAIGAGPDPGALSVLPALRARRIAAIDQLVLSHPHPDHYGGLPAVLAALPIGELWDTGQAEAEAQHEGAATTLLREAHARGVRVRAPGELCGQRLTFGASSLEVLSPCPAFELTREANDNSFVIRLTHGNTRFLFVGDAEAEAEADLAPRGDAIHSDVLKVGHHGSRTSSTPAFLAAVRPSLAVVSAGRGNSFGHPHREVVQRLASHARVLRTDLHGGVEVMSDGRTIRVQTARAGPR